MIIKANVKGKEIEIEIPDSEYWINRNKKRVSKYWDMADNLEKRINKEFEKAYNELEKELFRFAGKYGVDGQLSYSNNRIIALMKEIKPYIDSLYEEQQITLTEHLNKVYEENYYNGLYDIAIGTKVYSSFVGLNQNAIKSAITFPWSGESFSDRIYNNKNKLINTLRQEITQSIIRGEGTKQTAKIVSDRLNISKENAGRLIQTETAAVMSSSDKRMYDDYGFSEYQYVSTLDNRTSEVCRGLDGKVFLVNDMMIGVNAPPMHPRCRSTTIPYFDDNIGKRIARNLNTGKDEYVASNVTYEEWYKSYID